MMEAQMMINTIATRLNSMGIFFRNDNMAEVTIQTEFLDAAWASGNKKIEYQVSAFFNEAERTLYFWEFTKETSSGISFGIDSESSFQSGMTVFRKVKSVGYGPDGKAYEYNLDLGAIVKVFKETAKQQGWKFKVVLKREKAQQVDEPKRILDTHQTETGSTVPQKGKKLWWGLVVFLGLVTITFFGISGTSAAGWLAAAVIFVLLFFVQRKMAKKGCLFDLLLWVVALVLIFVTFAVTTTSSTTKTSKSTVTPLQIPSQKGKVVDGKFQIALQNMVYSYMTAEFLTAEVLQVDVTLVAKADWEANYNTALQAWQRAQQHAQVFDQLLAQMPVQVSVMPESKGFNGRSENPTLASRGSMEAGSIVRTWLTGLEPRPVYALGEEVEVELTKSVSLTTEQKVLLTYNALPPGDKLKALSREFNKSTRDIYGILNENFSGDAKLYGYKDNFYNAASKTAQAIETASDVGLFVGDIMTGGGGKFSIAKSGIKNFAKTALITSVSGADLVIQIGETLSQIGVGSAETGAWISSARSNLSPFTTLLSLKSIGIEGLESPGNIKTIVGWYLLAADKGSENANVLKVEDNKGQTEVRGFNNPKLAEKLDENEVTLNNVSKLNQFVKPIVSLTLDKKVKEEPTIPKPSTESASKPNLEPTQPTPIVTPIPKPTPIVTPTPEPTQIPAPILTQPPTAPIPPAQQYDYQAALGAWASDFAAEVNGRVYPSDGVSNRTNEFEWVRAPYIKDEQVLGASKIWQTTVFYAGEYAGRTIRSTTNEYCTADNPGAYISVGELRKKYPQFEH